MFRSKKILANLALSLCAIAFTLVLLEVALRVFPVSDTSNFGRDRGFFSRFDEDLGWRALPSVESKHTHRGFSVWVSQNEMGLRTSQNLGPERRNDKYRVLVLGDSYVWGYGAEQTDLFSEPAIHGEPDLEFINFGVSGYGTDQALLWYLDSGAQFDVDEVILAFTPYNDVSNNLHGMAYGYGKPKFKLRDGVLVRSNHTIADDPQRRWRHMLLTHSRIAALVNDALLNRQYRKLRDTKRENGIADAVDRIRSPKQVTKRDRYGVDLSVAIIDELERTVTESGAKFTVTFIPYKPHVIAGVERNHPLVPMLMEGLDDSGVTSFDPYDEFLAASKDGEALYNLWDNHFNASGHALFAEILVDFLRRERPYAFN